MRTAFRSEESFTQEEFWEWLQELDPRDIHRYELLGGHILMTPPTAMVHGAVTARIVGALDRHARRIGSGMVLCGSAGFDLPNGDTLEPDATFISAARLEAAPKSDPRRFAKFVPDLVVEVLSPSTARRDRTVKKRAYAECGVDEYWLVDPTRRTVEIFSREGEEFGDAHMVRTGRILSGVAAGLELTIEELFAGLE